MDHKVDSCNRIFNELIDCGCIAATRKIEASDAWTSFHAGLCTIHYNPKMNELDENSIRISLLHEEGHIRLQYRTFLFLILLFAILTSIFLTNFNLILKILGSVIIIFILGLLFVLIDEYESDIFASKLLRDKFGISEPSKILEKALEKMPSNRFSAYTHPSIQNRMRNIADNVDKKDSDYSSNN